MLIVCVSHPDRVPKTQKSRWPACVESVLKRVLCKTRHWWFRLQCKRQRLLCTRSLNSIACRGSAQQIHIAVHVGVNCRPDPKNDCLTTSEPLFKLSYVSFLRCLLPHCAVISRNKLLNLFSGDRMSISMEIRDWRAHTPCSNNIAYVYFTFYGKIP